MQGWQPSFRQSAIAPGSTLWRHAATNLFSPRSSASLFRSDDDQAYQHSMVPRVQKRGSRNPSIMETQAGQRDLPRFSASHRSVQNCNYHLKASHSLKNSPYTYSRKVWPNDVLTVKSSLSRCLEQPARDVAIERRPMRDVVERMTSPTAVASKIIVRGSLMVARERRRVIAEMP